MQNRAVKSFYSSFFFSNALNEKTLTSEHAFIKQFQLQILISKYYIKSMTEPPVIN